MFVSTNEGEKTVVETTAVKRRVHSIGRSFEQIYVCVFFLNKKKIVLFFASVTTI